MALHLWYLLLAASLLPQTDARAHRPLASRADIAKHFLQTLKLSITGELLKTDSVHPGEDSISQL